MVQLNGNCTYILKATATQAAKKKSYGIARNNSIITSENFIWKAYHSSGVSRGKNHLTLTYVKKIFQTQT